MFNLPRLRARASSFCVPFLAPVALLLPLGTVCYAQTGFASISGRVADHSGLVIQKAEVTLKNLDTNVAITSQTNNDGIYSFPSVPPGNYVMRVEKQGFRSVDVTGMTLYTQDQLARNFTLEVGSTSESVTVTAGTTNDSPAVSLTVEREFIEDMPLNGRSLTDLVGLAPGAASALQGNYSIDGQRADSNNYTVDGVSAQTGGTNNTGGISGASGASGSVPAQSALGTSQSLVGLDALQEFTIQTSGYTAEFGRNPGGQVQLTTRSGTDTVHGSLFEYLRNTVLDANSWSNDVNNLPIAAEEQNDFGGTVGGPLQISRFYDGKGKTFYFVSYEGLRLLVPNSGIYSGIPSDAFRAWASPNVQPFLGAMPDPADSPGYQPTVDACEGTLPNPAAECDGTIPYSYSSRNDLDAMSFRVDHTLSSRWKIFLRYADTPSSSTIVNYNGGTTSNGSHLWTAGATAGLSKNIVSETRFNFTHESEYNIANLTAWQGSKPFSPNLTVSSQYLSNPFAGPDVYIGPANTSINANLEYGGFASVQRQFEFVQSLNWTRKNHTFKFGVDWRHILFRDLSEPYLSTVEILSLDDVQQGNASDLSITAITPSYPAFNNLSLYVQDHWKIGVKLTLDYGLRWEFDPPPSASQGYSPLAINQISNLATTQALPFGSPLYQTQYDKLAPRFGCAYRMNGSSSNHPIVLRGGGGIFYDTGQQVASEAFLNGYPFAAYGPALSEVPLPLTQADLAAPSVSLTPPYGGIYYFTNPNLTLPYTEEWSLSLDRTMNTHNVLTASYVGNAGHKLLDNPLYRSTSGSLDPAVFTAGEAYINQNGASSSYNSLLVMDQGKIARDLQMVGSYTWSHALDDLSLDSYLTSLERGNSNYDLRQMLNIALNYQVPLEKGGLLRSFGSGWLLATRFIAQGGLPIDLFETRTFNAQNSNTYTEFHPNRVPGQPIYLHGSAAGAVPRHWRLNRAAFACTASTLSSGACSGTPTVPGTLSRNYIRNPTFNNFNLSAQRTFPIYERLTLNFRVDAFNVFNHINVYAPLTYTFADSQFGVLTGAEALGSANTLYQTGAARSLQLNLHLQF
jgi:hypothetical protein